MTNARDLRIFLSYRRDDGEEFARLINDSLHGSSISTADGGISISMFFDQASTPVADWEVLFQRELESSGVWILICSPGTLHRFTDTEDFLYKEIDWWIKNRRDIAPVVLTPKGLRWVPASIKEAWPNLNTIDIDLPVGGRINPLVRERILDGVLQRSPGFRKFTNGLGPDGGNQLFLYSWRKDKNLKYICCNENYARAAGLDSPASIVGMDDYQMPWRELADYFREGDRHVIDAKLPSRYHVLEKEIMVDRVADILVTENQLRGSGDRCLGVDGYFIDVTDSQIPEALKRGGSYGSIPLGGELGGVELSVVERDIIAHILSNYPKEYISNQMSLPQREVEEHIRLLRVKLQARSDGELVDVAMRNAVPLFIEFPAIGGVSWMKS
jgi:hypothetical protein